MWFFEILYFGDDRTPPWPSSSTPPWTCPPAPLGKIQNFEKICLVIMSIVWNLQRKLCNAYYVGDLKPDQWPSSWAPSWTCPPAPIGKLQDCEYKCSGQYGNCFKATATRNAMHTTWETWNCIHDHNFELLPEPVHLLLLGQVQDDGHGSGLRSPI